MAEIIFFENEKERLKFIRGELETKELKPMPKKGTKNGRRTSKKKLPSD